MSGTEPFYFEGTISPSKSELIRALVLKSYSPELKIFGASQCDDVRAMSRAVDQIERRDLRNTFDLGDSGLALRLVLARLSRCQGEFKVTGSTRLMDRPHGPLIDALSQLGGHLHLEKSQIHLTSDGNWKSSVAVDVSSSSQFASALVLNAWELGQALQIELIGEPRSLGYLDMSIALARSAGMEIASKGRSLEIPAGQKISAQLLRAETDMSTAFSVAALAVVNGSAKFFDFREHSLQPDHAFLQIIRELGARAVLERGTLRVDRAPKLRAIDKDLSGTPDLFPVLSVLCGLAEGRSRLYGAPHLIHKESNRIASSARLLRLLGRDVQELSDGLVIDGRKFDAADHLRARAFFDPDQDHRQVMAAYVARVAGFSIEIQDAEAVRKSAPEFLEWVRAYA